jgi:hypothetical protein
VPSQSDLVAVSVETTSRDLWPELFFMCKTRGGGRQAAHGSGYNPPLGSPAADPCVPSYAGHGAASIFPLAGTAHPNRQRDATGFEMIDKNKGGTRYAEPAWNKEELRTMCSSDPVTHL